MIVRTPPRKKQRADARPSDSSPVASDRQLVIYEDLPAVADPPAEHLLCTYQCRQMVKAEFLDALSNAEKQLVDYKSKWETLTEDFSKVEGEKKKFKEQLLYVEQELAAARVREQGLQKQLLKEIDDSKERYRKHIQSYSELEVKLQNDANLRKKAESAVTVAEEKVEDLQRHLNRLSESTGREKKSLQNELVQVKKESKFSISRINAEVEKLEFRATNAEKESELLKEQLEDLMKQLNECAQQKSELEKRLATSTFHEISSTDTTDLVKHLQEELRIYESEVQEARQLKSSHEQAALLREKLLEERSRRERAELELSKLEELHFNIKCLDNELSPWKATEGIPELPMIIEERDKLRSLVSEPKSLKKDDAGQEGTNQVHMQELQSSLAKKECFIKELESSLHGQIEFNNRQHEEIKLLSESLSNESRRIKILERDNDRLRSQISLLESKLGHGDFSSASTKVLRMVNTLGVDSEAKQTIEALQSELQKTKDKLRAVEELNNQSGNAVKLVDSHIPERMVQLKEQIATLEKREERYKTVFADRISVFRRACCELFGYKIVMDEHPRPNGIPVTRFTLQSIYGQNDDEKLEFEYESGNVVILSNSFTSQSEIARQVGIFINKLNSIPAFTANLTVESFNRRTLS